MRIFRMLFVLSVLGVVCTSFLGCGTVDILKADLKMQSGNYPEAVAILKAHLAESPDSVLGRTTLGMVYLKMDNVDDAIAELSKVQIIKPGESKSTLFLGLAYIGKGEYEKAIATWEGFKTRNSIVLAEIKKQLTLLKITHSRKMAQRALLEEQKLAAIKPQNNTFAVCYYADASPGNSFRAFQKALAAMVISDLAKIDSIQIVERIQLQSLFMEMKLGQTGIVDPATAPRVGHLIGAENLVVGTLSAGSIRTDTSLASTSSKKVMGNTTVTVNQEAFFQLPKAIALSVAKLGGIVLTPGQMEILGTDHTKSYDAVISFGKALMALDSDNWKTAREYLLKALEYDPRWLLAQETYDTCPPDASPTIAQLLAMPPLTMMKSRLIVVENAIEAQAAEDERKKQEERESGKGGGGGGH